MELDQKGIVRDAVKGYLSESDPGSLPEFEAVFESAYDTLASYDSDVEDTERLLEDEGCSFSAMLVSQAAVSMACVVAFAFLKAALKDSVRRDLPAILDRLEAKLSRVTGRPALVKAIRQRMEGILQNL